MADIAPQPFINYGLSQAQQGQASASAALEGQQAQGAAMQNQIMAAKLPFLLHAYEQAGAQADTSGVVGQGEPGGPLAARQAQLDEHAFDPENVAKSVRSKYTVPEWTDQEKEDQQRAPFMGPEFVASMAMRRQQRLDSLHQQSQVAASNEYDKYAAVYSAPSALQSIRQVDPAYYSYLTGKYLQEHPGADLDAKAKGYAGYKAAMLHQFTGRPLETKNDMAVDKATGLPVAGVPKLPLSAKDQADLIEKAQTPSIEIQSGVPGQTKKVAPWQAAHFKSVQEYLNAVAHNAAPSPEALNDLTAGKVLSPNDLAQLRLSYKTRAIQDAAQNGAPAPAPTTQATPDPANPGALMPVPKRQKPAPTPTGGGQVPQQTPGAAGQAPGATAPAPAGAAAPGAAAPGAAPPPPAGAAPTSRPFQGTETLEGTNADSLPKYTSPVNAPGVSASTQQGLDITAQNTEKYRQRDLANQHLRQNATERGLLDQAQSEIERLKNDPRAVGPGSAVTTVWNEFRSYATGKTPDPLTERKMFDKVLLQLGAANVKQAFDNQSRIGQQEYMKLLTEGNPTGMMPLDAIQKLVNFARYNNEFSTRVTNTRVDGLNRGADPYSREYNNLDQGRSAYVQKRMGIADKKDPYEVGKLYPGEGGARARYKGNGQWDRQ